jgi:hypothetical protein
MRSPSARRAILAALAAAAGVAPTAQGAAAADANEANNPLTPKITINFHDYYTQSFHGLPDSPDANSFLLRGLIPSKLGGAPQLFRFTLPVNAVPSYARALPPRTDGHDSGVGDLTLMDLFIVPGKVEFGVGPLLVAPTASRKETGQGRWQAGAAGVAVAPQSWGIIGGLATYQHSFAGGSRPDQSLLTVQPILNVNLPRQFYLRSSGTMNFDLENKTHYIPVGLGVGRVWALNAATTMNTFVEPQYTVAHKGAGSPKWQIFGGVNFQFALAAPAALSDPVAKP